MLTKIANDFYIDLDQIIIISVTENDLIYKMHVKSGQAYCMSKKDYDALIKALEANNQSNARKADQLQRELDA